MGAVPPEGRPENAAPRTPCIQNRQTQTFVGLPPDGGGVGDIHPPRAVDPHGQ